MKFEITDIEVMEDGVEHYPLFCCQFLTASTNHTARSQGCPMRERSTTF